MRETKVRKRPLAGCRILDFSTLLPGPFATQILGEAGAEVVKIERPEGGDELRAGEPRWGDASLSFALLNGGKRSIAIDLKLPIERERLVPLIRRRMYWSSSSVPASWTGSVSGTTHSSRSTQA